MTHPEWRADLLREWKAWDAKPSNEQKAIAYETACRPAAQALHLTVSALRNALNAQRQSGRTHAESIAAVTASRATR